MTGHEFEAYCATILRRKGFRKVEVTKGSKDQGIDILAVKHGKTYAVQCKYYQHPVGNKAVQQAYTGRTIYDADYAMIMTNTEFTSSAIEAAERTDVILWPNVPDRNRRRLQKALGAILLLGILITVGYFRADYRIYVLGIFSLWILVSVCRFIKDRTN